MAVGIGINVGVAVSATVNSGTGAGVGVRAGSPQATPAVTASARTPMIKYLFKFSTPGSGYACLTRQTYIAARIISSADSPRYATPFSRSHPVAWR